MKTLRAGLAALATAAVALTLAACGGDDGDDGEETAGNGGGASITVYSGRDEELIGDLVEQFEEATGADVDVRYGDTAELAATILEEGDNTPADVFFSQDAGALGALQKEDRLAELPQRIVRRVDRPFRSRDNRWVGVSGRARVVAYDSRELAPDDLPDSILEFTAEEWSGRVGWAPTNASFQSFVTALRELRGDDEAERWLRDMVANDVQAYENNVAVRDAIAAGEIDVGFINHYYVVQARAEEGEDYPVAIHQLPGGDPGSLVNVAGVGRLAASDNEDAALDFVDYLLRQDAQRYFSEETKEYPLIDAVEPDPTLVPLTQIDQPNIDLSDLDDLEGTTQMIERTGAL